MSGRAVDLELDAAIREVTVFEDRARIVRSASVALEEGQQTLRLCGLTAALDPGSLRARVAGEGSSRVVSLTAGWEAQESPSREEEARLIERVEELEHRLEELRDRLTVLGARRHLLETYRDLAREAVGQHAATGDQKPDRWAAALDFLTREESAGDEVRRGVEREIQEGDRELRARRAELQRLRSPRQRKTRFVEFAVRADAPGTAEVAVEYVVREAGWQPAYDVRAEGDDLVLTANATVTQGTGEDWQAVRLALSTARPGEAVRVPELTPLLLSGYAREKRPVTILSYGTEARRGGAEAEEEVAAPEPAPAAAPSGGGGRTRAEESVTAVRFVVDGDETVPADRRPHRVELMRLALDAELTYETLPKLAPFVHRKATWRNPAQVPLLAGPLDVYRASGFVGSGQLEHVAPGQEASFSLGTEEDFSVRRIIDEKVDRKPRLLGSKRTLTHAYRIELTNRSDEPRTVILVENIPVSQRDEIEVEIGRDTRPDERDDDGFLRWQVALEPGQRREIDFAFSISYPKDWSLAGI